VPQDRIPRGTGRNWDLPDAERGLELPTLHYHLPALFREIRPILEAKGPLAGPGAPKIGLRWDPEATRPAA